MASGLLPMYVITAAAPPQATSPVMSTTAPDTLGPQPATERPVRELQTRSVHGLDVALLWCEVDNVVFVRVEDRRTGEAFSVPVRRGQSPLEVFHHPYAYAPATQSR